MDLLLWLATLSVAVLVVMLVAIVALIAIVAWPLALLTVASLAFVALSIGLAYLLGGLPWALGVGAVWVVVFVLGGRGRSGSHAGLTSGDGRHWR